MFTSAARINLKAAASSRKPITTLTVFSHDPLLGSALSRAGNSARMKNGRAKVTENARAPSTSLSQSAAEAAEADRAMKPPQNGASEAQLMPAKVSALAKAPSRP